MLAFASLLLTGGILGDRYGRKKMFLTGLADVHRSPRSLCGLSNSSGQLIAFRAIQGVGAALLMPGTLSILTVTFPPRERAKAIGLWAGVSGLALALGPTLGGYMVEHLGWESIFFLNVPIGSSRSSWPLRTVARVGLGAGASAGHPGLRWAPPALFCLTYALIEANQQGLERPDDRRHARRRRPC